MRAERFELAGLWLAIFAQTTSFTAYSPLVPLMRADLGFSYTDFGLLATAFYIPYTALQVFSGSLAGRGRIRSLMLPGMAAIIASTALLGAVTNLTEALVLRFVTGAGGAMIFVPSVMVITRRYPDRTNFALGAYGTGVAAGPLFVSLAAPTLGTYVGWRLAMPALMLPTVAVWAIIYLGVRNFSPPARTKGKGSSVGWVGVLKNRTTWLLGYQQLARVGMWATFLTFLPTFFTAGLGYPMVTASAALTVFAVLAMLSSVLGARLVTTMNSNAKVTMLSLAAMAVGLMLIGFTVPGALPWVLAGVLGLVVFMAFGPQLTMATQFFPLEVLGFAIGVQTVLANVGATVIPFVFGDLRDATGSFEASWELCGLLCAAAALVGLALWRQETKLAAERSPSYEVVGAQAS